MGCDGVLVGCDGVLILHMKGVPHKSKKGLMLVMPSLPFIAGAVYAQHNIQRSKVCSSTDRHTIRSHLCSLVLN
jgi:hypothetical protein